MSRLKSLLLCVALLAGLLGFANRTTFAQATTETIPHPPPRALAQLQAAAAPTDNSTQSAPEGPEQRVALVIGNSNYQNAAQLANPGNDAQSMAEFLSSAGFEVISATNLTENDMIRVVQDFSAKVAARGPNTVAMVYYAGHGVQIDGRNYLVPVDLQFQARRHADRVRDRARTSRARRRRRQQPVLRGTLAPHRHARARSPADADARARRSRRDDEE